MPRVTRKRRLAAPAHEVWRIVSDPYHLPRWWPRTQRVENVSDGGPEGRKWTQVLETKDGRGIRADYLCVTASREERLAYEQIVEDTPFERFLQSARTEIELEAAGEETEVTLRSDQRLRGLSRLGGFMMRRATGRTLMEALRALDESVSAAGRSPDGPAGAHG